MPDYYYKGQFRPAVYTKGPVQAIKRIVLSRRGMTVMSSAVMLLWFYILVRITFFTQPPYDLEPELEERLNPKPVKRVSKGDASLVQVKSFVANRNPTPYTPILLDPLPPVRSKFAWPPVIDRLLCAPKIYVYPDPPAIEAVYRKVPPVNTPYISERILLGQLRDPSSTAYKNYVTLNPEEADFFLIPFLGARYLNHCWFILEKTDDCDVDQHYVRPMMNRIQKELPYWNRTQGANHIMIHPMDRTSMYYKSRDIMLNATFLTTIGDKRPVTAMAGRSRRYKDIVIPSATALLDLVHADPTKYLTSQGHPRQKKRDIFVIFGGRYQDVAKDEEYSAGIRSLFLHKLDQQPDYMMAPGWETDKYMKLLSRSRYGLAPMGHTLDTTRIWEYIAFGVVPVIMADGIIEPFEDDVDWDSMSVRVRHADAHRVDAILRAIPEEEYQRKRAYLWEYGRRMLLTRDPWHYIVRALCRKGSLEGARTINHNTHVNLTEPFRAVKK